MNKDKTKIQLQSVRKQQGNNTFFPHTYEMVQQIQRNEKQG
jgi:hypothetical protein